MKSAFGRILVSGFLAGTVATAAQLLLWWISSVSLPEVLYRDTRLTAAIVMSHEVIRLERLFRPPEWTVWLAATAIHFALSFAYAAIFHAIAGRLRVRGLGLPALGLGFGLALYFINMHGFTFVMPWFALVRDGITIAAHAAFGLCLGLVVWANTRSNAPLLPI